MSGVRARRAALEAANQQLRAANQALEAFTRSLTHDVGGPLRTIRGFAEILNEEYAGGLDAQGRDYLRRVASGAQRPSDLVYGLLTFFRMTRAGDPAPLERVTVESIAKDVLRQLQPELESRSAAVDLVRRDPSRWRWRWPSKAA